MVLRRAAVFEIDYIEILGVTGIWNKDRPSQLTIWYVSAALSEA